MTNWLLSLESNTQFQGVCHQVSGYVNHLETQGGVAWNNLLNEGVNLLHHLETNP